LNPSYFLINIAITILGRSLDLLSTYYITPNLALETNRLVKGLGWKGSILLQIPIVALGAFFRPIAIFFLMWSIIIASSNISGAWFVRNIPGGDAKYAELLAESSKRAKLRHIILDETPPLVLFVLPNMLILVWIQLDIGNILDLVLQETFISYIIIITGAFILHGFMSFIRNVLYISRLRRAEAKTASEEQLAES
jgi:hypothetical protein